MAKATVRDHIWYNRGFKAFGKHQLPICPLFGQELKTARSHSELLTAQKAMLGNILNWQKGWSDAFSEFFETFD
jgi:hypothetical protein